MKSVTDGEFRRGLWHMDFVCDFANVVQTPGIPIKFHSDQGEMEYTPPGVKITGKLSRPHPIFVEDFKFLKDDDARRRRSPFPRRACCTSAAAARRSTATRIRTWTSSTPTSRAFTARRSAIWSTPAAATCRSTK